VRSTITSGRFTEVLTTLASQGFPSRLYPSFPADSSVTSK
jgi:hypothetical protein